MADNCVFFKNGKCNPPEWYKQGAACSWLNNPDYQQCAIYKAANAKNVGGGLLDQLRAAGIIKN